MNTEFFILRLAYLLNLYSKERNKDMSYRVGLQKIHQLLEHTCRQLEHYYYRYILYPNLLPYKKTAAPGETLGSPLAG